MFSPRRDHIRLFDEALFHDLTSFAELEARMIQLEDPQRQKHAFAVFAEGFLALRSVPGTVELLPSHRLTDSHRQRLSLPDALPGVDGFVFLAGSGCHPYHLLFAPEVTDLPATVWDSFDALLRQSHWPLLMTNLRQLPDHWLKREGYQHVTGNQFDRLSPSWFAHFLRWLQSGSQTRRPTAPSQAMTETVQRLRALPGGVATWIAPEGPAFAELLFHLATFPGQRRLTLILTPGVGRIMDLMQHWREHVSSVPLSCTWVAGGRDRDRNENRLPGEMDFFRVQDVAAIRQVLTHRDAHPRILWATHAAVPLIQQAQLGLPPIELLLMPDSHVLAQQAKSSEAQLPSGFPGARLRLHFTAIPRRTHPLKKNRMEQPAILHDMEDEDRFGRSLPLSTLTSSRERLFHQEWKLLLVPVEAALLQQPQPLLRHVLAACCREYPDIRHIHMTLEGTPEPSVFLPGQGEFSIVPLEPELDVLAGMQRLGQFSRLERGILALRTIPAPLRHAMTADLTWLPSCPGNETDSWHERFGAVPRPGGRLATGLVAVVVPCDEVAEVHDGVIHDPLLPLCMAVQTLRDLDPGFDQAVDGARRQRGRKGEWNLDPLMRWLQFMPHPLLPASGQQRLLAGVITRLTSPWWEGLGELERFHEQAGHVDVPSGFSDLPGLATWVDGQRKGYARGTLSAQQIALLDQLGFVWDPKKAAWDRMYSILSAFHARVGHCRVEHPYPEDGSLSQWVLRQRQAYQQQRLEPGLIERLNALGFVWDFDAWEWEHYYGKLLRFKSLNPHAWVTDPFPRDPELGTWAARQRQLQQKGRLEEHRRQQLDEAGFVWDLEAADWQQELQQLVVFRRLYGHAQVEIDDARHPGLAAWCQKQRDLRQKRQLISDRVRQLDETGFVWDLEEAHWQERFSLLKDFQRRHGHLSLNGDDSHVLPPWIEEQRQLRARNRLHPTRIDRLNALGFIWSAKEERWEGLFQRFLHFRQCHLHGDVPERWPEDPELGDWVQMQRREARRGAMDEDRRARLTMAGFVWDPAGLYWERMFQSFARFQRHHGEDDPAKVDPDLAPLGDWMASQRRMRISGRLEGDRIQRLDALGFVWDVEAKFERDMMRALGRFMVEQGHCNIPPDWNRPPTLSAWVRKLRTRKATGALTRALEVELERMGFVWDAREAAWNEMYAALETFSRHRHHCIVPDPFPENPRLLQWVSGLRKQYRNDALDQEKMDRLNLLGFVWDAKAVLWEEMFVALTAFHDRFGHCLVSESDPHDSKLAWWVAAQRKARAGGQLNERQIQRLDRLHFVWDANSAQWLEMYRELFFFHQRYGHCLVKNDTPYHARLNDWCGQQRKARLMGYLEPEQQERLDLLGFIWDPKEVVVEEMLQDLARFKERFGHCNVPVQWADNPQLGLWIQFQRQSCKKGTLDPQRKLRLEAMGLTWEPEQA
ncbi:MAG: Helicase associated domain protein [Magnetococcales bacterium]|nr:Helicase associated domain protein [Magnetococcales bacterium]